MAVSSSRLLIRTSISEPCLRLDAGVPSHHKRRGSTTHRTHVKRFDPSVKRHHRSATSPRTLPGPSRTMCRCPSKGPATPKNDASHRCSTSSDLKLDTSAAFLRVRGHPEMKRRIDLDGPGRVGSEAVDWFWVSAEGWERWGGSGACIDVGCVQVDTGVLTDPKEKRPDQNLGASLIPQRSSAR